MQVDIDILVYAVIAALLLGRLWAVLGTRNEGEPQRPSPFAPPAKKREEVVADPQQNNQPRLQAFVAPPNSLEGGLAQVKAVDPVFEEKAFLQEARDIFSSVVGAYAAGRLMNVSEFLSSDLLAHFQKAVDARAAAGQIAQTRIARMKEAELLSAKAEGTKAFLTVRFVSEQENILRDAKGGIVGGAEGKVDEVIDVWTFVRDTQTSGVKWVVVETRA